MTQGHRTLKDLMLERLMLATGWTSGPDLAEGLSTSEPAIEDALADLVIEGKADFKEAVGYRLKASVLCRHAARMLKTQGTRLAVKGHPFEGNGKTADTYRVGIAEQRDDIGLVMYELEMPMPPKGPDSLQQHLSQIDGIINFAERKVTHA